ncbi:MAG: L-lactate dehydrogenase [Oscillospiraceae bacterium]|nr:L-lactate dehydrogenase [Oscillospiraceae bacterium]
MSKITVIGSGNVGSTIAYTLTTMGIASEIVMIDINQEKSLGEAMDIRQGTCFCTPVDIYAGSYADARNSEIVVITSGIARKPGQSRHDLAQANVEIIKSIADKIVPVAPNATYIIVSNPVDVLTYVFLKHTGLPKERVIGSGTVLDTARLRSRISEYYTVNQKNVHAYVLGEHGDNSFVPWSLANISNVPIEAFKDAIQSKTEYPDFVKSEVEEYMRTSGSRIIQRKGATFYAVSISVCHICKCLLSGVETMLTVSTLVNGEYGVDDVCLSLLNVVGKKGAYAKVILPLNEEEIAALHKSAKVLKDLIKTLNI